jgi:hypothetical protein
MRKLKFSKPTFSELKENYRTESTSIHACSVIDTTLDGINTCAARMSEALVIANRVVPNATSRADDPALAGITTAYIFGTPDYIRNRAAIAHVGNGKGDGKKYLLGQYGYGDYANKGKLCPHGIGRGAVDLAAFLKYHWGPRTLGWIAQSEDGIPPDNIVGKQGIVAFQKIPGFSGQGHIDLWDNTGPVGHQYWTSETIWFWSLS